MGTVASCCSQSPSPSEASRSPETELQVPGTQDAPSVVQELLEDAIDDVVVVNDENNAGVNFLQLQLQELQRERDQALAEGLRLLLVLQRAIDQDIPAFNRTTRRPGK